MTLKRYMWVDVNDALDILEGVNVPDDGIRRLIGKNGHELILKVVSSGHRIAPGENGGPELAGLVVSDHRKALWQARYTRDAWGSNFGRQVRGFVQFTRAVEAEPTRVFKEADEWST